MSPMVPNRPMYSSRILVVHYSDVIMTTMASQITSLTIVYSTVYSEADEWKYQSPASQFFVRGIHRWPVNSPHKGPVKRNMFPFDDVIMIRHRNGDAGILFHQFKLSNFPMREKILRSELWLKYDLQESLK